MKFEGTSRTPNGNVSYHFIDTKPQGWRAKLDVTDHVWMEALPHGVGDVLPPDHARHTALNSVDPLSAEAIALIGDPEVRARAILSAQQHASQAEAEAALKAAAAAASGEKTSGRCPRAKQKVQLTADHLASQRYVCIMVGCGKVFEKTKFKPVKEGDGWVFDVPGHNLPTVPVTAAAPVTAGGTPPALPTGGPPALPGGTPPALPGGTPPALPGVAFPIDPSAFTDRERAIFQLGQKSGQQSVARALETIARQFLDA